eukprot:GHRR01010030.1.p1 GENE.GHRR01010030.1~~GHRR01010030.1.p1  ORF type:complete len:182 (+),score=22.91 GHRR01010030.1:581-1126(+)
MCMLQHGVSGLLIILPECSRTKTCAHMSFAAIAAAAAAEGPVVFYQQHKDSLLHLYVGSLAVVNPYCTWWFSAAVGSSLLCCAILLLLWSHVREQLAIHLSACTHCQHMHPLLLFTTIIGLAGVKQPRCLVAISAAYSCLLFPASSLLVLQGACELVCWVLCAYSCNCIVLVLAACLPTVP